MLLNLAMNVETSLMMNPLAKWQLYIEEELSLYIPQIRDSGNAENYGELSVSFHPIKDFILSEVSGMVWSVWTH